MAFQIVCNDIVKVKADVLVNAANEGLMAGSGVCGAIFRSAGYDAMTAACREIGHCDTGSAVITPAFALPAKYVIHTVGPIWQGGSRHERDLLYGCYENSLALAARHKASSIAFPLISSGIFGYPKEEALQVCLEAVQDFLEDHDMTVYLVVFTPDIIQLEQKLKWGIAAYVAEHFRDPRACTYGHVKYSKSTIEADELCYLRLPEDLPPRAETFSEMLLRLIDEAGKDDVVVYKKANIDRKLFSKIRTNPDYTPSKKTVLALAIALELPRDQADKLLEKAGYSLSDAIKEDVIVSYFLSQHCYDIYRIQAAIFAFCNAE